MQKYTCIRHFSTLDFWDSPLLIRIKIFLAIRSTYTFSFANFNQQKYPGIF